MEDFELPTPNSRLHRFQHEFSDIHGIDRDLFSSGSGQDGTNALLTGRNDRIGSCRLDLVDLLLSQGC